MYISILLKHFIYYVFIGITENLQLSNLKHYIYILNNSTSKKSHLILEALMDFTL